MKKLLLSLLLSCLFANAQSVSAASQQVSLPPVSKRVRIEQPKPVRKKQKLVDLASIDQKNNQQPGNVKAKGASRKRKHDEKIPDQEKKLKPASKGTKRKAGADDAQVDDADAGLLLKKQKLTKPIFDEKRLVERAEKDGLGYKASNLLILHEFTSWFNKHYADRKLLPVEIPQFFVFSTATMIALLEKHGFELRARWATVVQTAADTKDIFEKGSFPDAFWALQKVFVTDLEQTFDKLNPEEVLAELLTQAVSGNMSAQQIFEHAQKNSSVFMVRSSGKEDTRAMANAGGNESIANVKADAQSFIAALKKVMISFFSAKSLNQRLGLGDKTVVESTIACGIIGQIMIGEVAGSIPLCGVAFSEETEGGISHLDNYDGSGKLATSGITMIQAAYGHNEGVVNSKVSVDTFVAQNLPGSSEPSVYPVIKSKINRLVPSDDLSLKMEKNESLLQTKSVLNKQELITLKLLADEAELFFGYPVDIEFVIYNKKLHPVQFRPIVHHARKKTQRPSYLENLTELNQQDVMKGRTIVSFGGATVSINGVQECIVNQSIGGALTDHLKRIPGRVVKAVFVGADAPVTSHEATMFRSEGIPVIFMFNFEKCSEMLNAGKHVIFSPQQHCAVLIENKKENEKQPASALESKMEDEDDVKDCGVITNGLKIVEGWCAYPLPQELSVPQLIHYASVQEKSIHVIKQAWENNIRHDEKISQLLEDIKGNDQAKIIHASSVLPAVLFGNLHTKFKETIQDQDLVNQVEQMVSAAKILCLRIIALSDQPLLQRLLPVNYLEALMKQQIQGNPALGYRSFASLSRILKQEKKILADEHHQQFNANKLSFINVPVEKKPEVGMPRKIVNYVASSVASFFKYFTEKEDNGADTQKSVVEEDLVQQLTHEKQALYRQLKKAGDVAFHKETSRVWRHFLNILTFQDGKNDDISNLEAVGNLVKQLDAFDVFHLWLHLYMQPEVESIVAKSDSLNILQQEAFILLASWTQSFEAQQDRFALLQQLKDKIHTFDVNKFSHSSAFNDAFAELLDLKKDFTDGIFLSNISASHNGRSLAGAVAAGLMSAFIELFDLSIKAMKGSDEYNKKEKGEAFKKMLNPFFDLLKKWLPLISEDFIGLPRIEQGHFKAAPCRSNEYLELIHSLVIKDEYSPADLEPTKGLNATVFTLGACHNWLQDKKYGNIHPRTAEDGYTILHQSLTNLAAALLMMVSNGSALEKLSAQLFPSIIEQFKDKFSRLISHRFGDISLVRLYVDKKKIEFTYNLPLGSHSLQIVLSSAHCAKKDSTMMTINVYGGVAVELRRWINAAILFVSYGINNNVKVTINTLHKHALSASFVGFEKDMDQFQYLLKLLVQTVKTHAPDRLAPYASQDESALNLRLTQLLKQVKAHDDKQLLGAFYWALLEIPHFQFTSIQKAEVVEMAKAFLEYGGKCWTCYALDMFNDFVARYDEGFDDAIVAATQGMKHDNHYVFDYAVNLFKTLVSKGQGYQEAIDAAIKAIRTYERLFGLPQERYGVFTLFDALFEADQGLQEVTKLVSDWVSERGIYASSLYVGLLKRLLQKNYGLEIVAGVVEAAGKEGKFPLSSERVVEMALPYLIEQGRSIELVYTFVKNIRTRCNGLSHPNAMRFAQFIADKLVVCGYDVPA